MSRFWPQVVLIVVQMSFKTFLENSNFYRDRFLPHPLLQGGLNKKGGCAIRGRVEFLRGAKDFLKVIFS